MTYETQMEAKRQDDEDRHIHRERFLENEIRNLIRDKSSRFYAFDSDNLMICLSDLNLADTCQLINACEATDYDKIGRIFVELALKSAKSYAESDID